MIYPTAQPGFGQVVETGVGGIDVVAQLDVVHQLSEVAVLGIEQVLQDVIRVEQLQLEAV